MQPYSHIPSIYTIVTMHMSAPYKNLYTLQDLGKPLGGLGAEAGALGLSDDVVVSRMASHAVLRYSLAEACNGLTFVPGVLSPAYRILKSSCSSFAPEVCGASVSWDRMVVTEDMDSMSCPAIEPYHV